MHPGLVPGGTVSLRCGEKFLRHRCGKLEFLGEDVWNGVCVCVCVFPGFKGWAPPTTLG